MERVKRQPADGLVERPAGCPGHGAL